MNIKNIGAKNMGVGTTLGAFLTNEQKEALGITDASLKRAQKALKQQVTLQGELAEFEEAMRRK